MGSHNLPKKIAPTAGNLGNFPSNLCTSNEQGEREETTIYYMYIPAKWNQLSGRARVCPAMYVFRHKLLKVENEAQECCNFLCTHA